MSDRLTERFAEFETEFNKLPDETILEIVATGKSSEIVSEKSMQRALFYFLNPKKHHGLENRFLVHFIEKLQKKVGFDEKLGRTDLAGAQVGIEVNATGENISGDVDVLIWLSEEFFICIEMKTRSPEGQYQTVKYEKADKFNPVDTSHSIEKSSIPKKNHHYIYLSKAGSPCPKSGSFKKVSWDWVSEVFDSWIKKANNAEGYNTPNRTLLQLTVLNQTIKKDLIDISNKEYENKKVNMYFEYYDEILEVKSAVDDQ